jgi:FMN phosphatase YigB (HAD superfamily)
MTIVWLATACQVDVRVDVAVDDDGSGTVTVGAGLDEEAMARIPDLADQLRTDDLEAAGWTVTGPEQESDGVTWVRASKPFDDPEQASAIIDEIAGDDGPFRDFTVTRSQSFGETSFTVEGVADFSDGLASFTDERVSELLGDGFGGNLDQIEDDTGAPAAEQVSVTFAAELPGGGTEVFELDPTSTEAQPIEAESTSTRWAARAWAVVAGVALVLLVVVVIVRLVRDQRDRRTRPTGTPRPVDAVAADEPDEHDTADAPPRTEDDRAPTEAESDLEPEPVAAAPAESRPPPRRLGVVVLDAMGVVFDTGADVTSLLADFLREQGINRAHDEVGHQLAQATLGQITPAEMWRSLGVDGNQAELTDQFLALHKPSPGLRSFLERMRDRELPVVVVSNDIADWSHSLRDTHKLGDLTAAWLVSSEVGHRLPDSAMYDEIVRVSGQDPRNTFFIDDEIRYLAAARSHGFAAAWFNPDPEPGDEDAGYPMIRSFRDFLGG